MKVVQTVMDTAEDLKNLPNIYPLDKYRKSNKGDIRAFEKFNLRIANRVTDSEIRILRFTSSGRQLNTLLLCLMTTLHLLERLKSNILPITIN